MSEPKKNPTWEEAVPALIYAIREGDEQQRTIAIGEIYKLARGMDSLNRLLK